MRFFCYKVEALKLRPLFIRILIVSAGFGWPTHKCPHTHTDPPISISSGEPTSLSSAGEAIPASGNVGLVSKSAIILIEFFDSNA